MPSPRQTRVFSYMAIALAGASAIVLLPDWLVGIPQDAHARIVAITAEGIAAAAWAYVFAKLAFRSADEMFRAAERNAWYSGGIAGLLASLPVFAFIALGGLHWLDPVRFGEAHAQKFAFVVGYVLPVLMQFAGFVAVRMWWSLARRTEA